MKKIILLNLFLILVTPLIAQESAAYYTKNLDAYTGTWEFQSDTCTFRLYLKKGKSYYYKGGRLSHEIIFGGHYVKRNGVVLIDLENAMKVATDEDSRLTIVASNNQKEEVNVNPNVLGFVFVDNLKDKWGIGQLTLIPGDTLQLHWQIQSRRIRPFVWIEGVDQPPPPIAKDWTTPTDVILTKIADGDPDPITPPGKPGFGGKDPDIITP